MKLVSTAPLLTFDDILLLPRRSRFTSRFGESIDLSTKLFPTKEHCFNLTIPIVSANMDTVTGHYMAKVLGDLGAVGIIHRFMTPEHQLDELTTLKIGNDIACIGVGEAERARLSLVLRHASAVLIDIAHGHSDLMIDQIKYVKDTYPSVGIIAGNVCTPDGALDLIDAGADCIKVGVGPGCFIAGTRVLLSNGFYRNIEEITSGDRVIGSDGKPALVLGAKNSGFRDVVGYRHAQFYKPSFCTPDHLHWVGDLNSVSNITLQSRGPAKVLKSKAKTTPKSSKYKWKAISKIKQDVLLLPKKIQFELPETFSIILKKRDCKPKFLTPSYDTGYILGLFLGDGCASCTENNGSHSGSITWYLGREEEAIAQKLCKAIYSTLELKTNLKIEKNLIKVHLYYKPLADFLQKAGKKNQKHLFQELLVDNIEYLKGLYDGLIDSDGHIEDYGRVNFKNTSSNLIELFNVVCYLVTGIWPSNTSEQPSAGGLEGVRDEDCSISYRARLGTLKEKRQTTNYQVIDFLENVPYLGELVETYDIEVDNQDHSFIANNAIVHNSLCTTRIKTGHGMPQLSAIMLVREAIGQTGKPVTLIADGGIRNSGDIVKALAAGADAVMVGSLFAGTDESPGKKFRGKNGLYKVYRGMASKEAQEDWKGYATSVEGEFQEIPSKGSVVDVFKELVNGILSGMSYQNAGTLKELRDNAEFVLQTQNGYRESTPHGL